MAKKEFYLPKFVDYEIYEDGTLIGHVRVKPSGIAWADKGSQSWNRLSIEDFANLAKKHGTKQEK
jgi:hypothetical protein